LVEVIEDVEGGVVEDHDEDVGVEGSVIGDAWM